MANNFIRFAIEGGDEDDWADFEEPQNYSGTIGACYCNLYDDSGTLKITKGRVGIDDGTNTGTAIIDTVTTISIAGVSNSNWAKIEVSVSGVGVTIAAADISGATDETALPAGFTDAWDGNKGGFYIAANKRCIGLAWKNAGGTLEGIINVGDYSDSYSGYSISDDAYDNYYSFIKDKNEIDTVITPEKCMYLSSAGVKSIVNVATKIIEIGDWNMNTTPSVTIETGVDYDKIIGATALIRDNTGNNRYMINLFGDSADPTLLSGGVGTISAAGGAGKVDLRRRLNGSFDSGSFDSTSYNRGFITIRYIV